MNFGDMLLNLDYFLIKKNNIDSQHLRNFLSAQSNLVAPKNIIIESSNEELLRYIEDSIMIMPVPFSFIHTTMSLFKELNVPELYIMQFTAILDTYSKDELAKNIPFVKDYLMQTPFFSDIEALDLKLDYLRHKNYLKDDDTSLCFSERLCKSIEQAKAEMSKSEDKQRPDVDEISIPFSMYPVESNKKKALMDILDRELSAFVLIENDRNDLSFIDSLIGSKNYEQDRDFKIFNVATDSAAELHTLMLTKGKPDLFIIMGVDRLNLEDKEMLAHDLRNIKNVIPKYKKKIIIDLDSNLDESMYEIFGKIELQLTLNWLEDSFLNKYLRKRISKKIDAKSFEKVTNIILTKPESIDLINYDIALINDDIKKNKALSPQTISTVRTIHNYEDNALVIRKMKYVMDGINTDMPVSEIIEKAKLAVNGRKSFKLIFYGISGSGKTYLANYLSEKLKMPLILKHYSDIANSMIGETEKKIASAFKEAEKAILFFDEADSFIPDRAKARYGWERTQTNEFLTMIDQFQGILILSTNLLEIMDKAMLRRFDFTIEFLALTSVQIRRMVEEFWSNYSFCDDELNKLERTGTVTPSDFSLATKRLSYNKNPPSKEDIFRTLFQIQKEKHFFQEKSTSRQIGFSISEDDFWDEKIIARL